MGHEKAPDRSPEPLVIKFGGTSVGGGPEFVRAARMVAEEAARRPVAVVVSAMGGTTDTLLGYAEATDPAGPKAGARTATGATLEGSVAELHRTLAGRHLDAARHAVSGEHLPEVEAGIYRLLGGLLDAIGSEGESPEARRAEIAVYGERLSACIMAGAIASLGVPASVCEDPIATDEDHAEAEVDPERTRERAAGYVAPALESGSVAVVPGFVGRSPGGAQTTLGRGGSDLSATALAQALGSLEVWICSDVDGVLDADPKLVAGARLIPRLSYQEAASLAGCGAKVLHPKTMKPAREAGIEVLVRSTFNPECTGTLVCSREPREGVRGLGLRRGLSQEHCAGGLPDSPVSGSGGAGESAVVCVGSPGCGELSAGLAALEERGVAVRWAGPCADGLLFVVGEEESREALGALHGSLVGERTGEGITVPEEVS